jgi:hypothetical protein
MHDMGHIERELNCVVTVAEYEYLHRMVGMNEHADVSDPSKRSSVICIALEEFHYAVLEIKPASRQVVVYDGFDETPKYLERVEAGNTAIANEAKTADRVWRACAHRLLRVLRLTEESNEFEIEVGSDKIDGVRKEGYICNGSEKWQVVTPPLVYDDWRKRLIRQNDEYSCGRIAAIHVLNLLGQPPTPIWYADELAECRPISTELTLETIRPNWKTLFGKWLSEAAFLTGSQNEKQLLQFYCVDSSAGLVDDEAADPRFTEDDADKDVPVGQPRVSEYKKSFGFGYWYATSPDPDHTAFDQLKENLLR